MPLTTPLPALMARSPSTISLPSTLTRFTTSQSMSEEGEKDSGYEDFDQDESDMDSLVHPPRSKTKESTAGLAPPTVPSRSDRRASRLLENVLLELEDLDGDVSAKEKERREVDDPHELYLSSEEDASLSDDYEDFDFEDMDAEIDMEEFDADEEGEGKPGSRASSRSEESARIVRFTIVQPPQIIQIVIPAAKRCLSTFEPRSSSLSNTYTTSYISPTSPTSPSTFNIPTKNTRRPSPLRIGPDKRMSISSTFSISTSNTSFFAQRNASKLSTIATSAKNSFLQSDPFAASDSPQALTQDGAEISEPPKTPASIAAAALKRGLGRTLKKARKGSMPRLSSAYKESEPGQRDSLRLARKVAREETMLLEEDRVVRRSRTMTSLDVKALEGLRNVTPRPVMRTGTQGSPEKEKERKSSLWSLKGR